MRIRIVPLVCLACFVWAQMSPVQAAQRRPIYEEIRAKQALGRALASPDGKFFLYEWARPYDWARDFGALPASVAEHQQTWLYRVDVNQTRPTSEYLFYPDSGASYWLGSLSPDSSKKVSFYQLDERRTI